MKEVLTATKVVAKIIQLINEGKKIKVFGLPYPPYQEDIVFTDEKVNRQGWLCTNSKVTLSASACATKIKIHTITGWCNLFQYVENGKYVDTISEDGQYIDMQVMDDICPGMLLGVAHADTHTNIGMILNVEDDEANNVRAITKSCNVNLFITMHINKKIDLLIRASRLYCHSMYQTYDPKYYPTIKGIVLNFTNKLFGTKPVENKVRIDIISLFSDDIKDRPGWKVYSGICILVEFPDNSALEYELFKHPLIPEGDIYYKPVLIPAKA